ncbi:MAG: amidohydrolase [Clostridia bacterium]|nr:amidohydrolase [Clostridia bacterium]
MNNILHEAEGLTKELIRIRRYLHSHPGVGFDIADTAAFVARELEDIGMSPRKCGRAGITALLGNNNRHTVLLRADMDALDISEDSQEPFASQNGHMHACGHDMHTAMLLGAARLLKAHENELDGCVKLMFQGAEEILSGASDMISSGVLDEPQVDTAVMIHVMTGIPIDTGSVIVAPAGVSAPAADMLEITVRGAGSHGSMPEKGVDPIITAAYIATALCEINARELSINNKAVLTLGSFNAGSSANVIPDTAVIKGSLRAYSDETREMLKRRVSEIVSNVSAAFRASADVRFTSGCPTLINDAELSVKMQSCMRTLLGEKHAIKASDMGESSSGSEDFAYVSHKVPSVMIALAAGDSRRGYEYPLHHPKVRFDEKALPVGAAVYAFAAMKLLSKKGN